MVTLKKPLQTSLISILLLLVLTSAFRVSGSVHESLLSVSFLDVGQGDATLIETPDGTQILIDGGKNSMVLRDLSKKLGFFDYDIDMVVITHPDLDHIGGLLDVFKKYEIKTILMTENESDTPAYTLLRKAIADERAPVLFARRGQVYDLGLGPSGSTTLTILFPDRDPTYLESNTSSIVAHLVYGESEFLFTGDSPSSIEGYLVSAGSSILQSDVLKVGHHGSKTSSAEAFLVAVSPEIGVISAAVDSQYGHPHKEVTDRLNNLNIPYKNTAENGSIHLVSDGERIWFK